MKAVALACTLAALVMASAHLIADTLVLVDGRRIQGELISVVGREIEFEERTGQIRRMMRVPREEILRIEFVNESQYAPAGPSSDNRNSSGAVVVPRGMRERMVSVAGNTRWNDTGIDVRIRNWY